MLPLVLLGAFRIALHDHLVGRVLGVGVGVGLGLGLRCASAGLVLRPEFCRGLRFQEWFSFSFFA